MDGVEILAVNKITTGYTYDLLLFLIVFTIVLGISCVTGIVCGIILNDWYILCIISLCGIILGGISGTLFCSARGAPVVYETQYKAIVSDEVPLNEFLSKYEIIEQEGKIYTIRERNQEDLQ